MNQKILQILILRVICSILLAIPATAQEAIIQFPQLSIQRTNSPIAIDGQLNEPVWKAAAKATNFWLQAPIDGEQAKQQTEVQMTYDDKFVYIAATCWDDQKYIIQTLKRDNFGESDAFAVLIDPVKEQTNGSFFAVNALGAQTEAALADGIDDSWDNKWIVGVENYSDRWTIEMAIPFKTLRYKTGIEEWGINFIRLEPGSNETHTWSPIPRQFDIFDLGYLGSLTWDAAPIKAGKNVSLIPYARVSQDNNFTVEPTAKSTDFGIGGDAKIALNSTLNLDLTFNPDFSQVEVDRQVTNLTRFNIFFPERRQFFIENADVFSDFGQFADRPFYSRRIGLDAGGNTVPIKYGVRLSGNLNSKLRIGLLNMHTDGNDQRAGQNYSALTFQHRLWKRSSIKGIFLNRQAFSDGESVTGDYGRNVGGEFNYSTPDGKWRAQTGYIESVKEGFNNKNGHLYGRFDYDGQNFRTFLTVQRMSENYFSDMGFTGRLFNFNPETNEVVRIGFTQIGNMLNYYIYPKESKNINFHWSGIENFVYFNPNDGLTEWYTRFRHFFFFKNTSQLRFRLNNHYVDLLFPFALTEVPLPAKSYTMKEFNIQFNTDLRKRLNTEWFIVYGQFYGGTKLTNRGSVSYRVQPWGNFSVGIEQNNIRLPEPYGDLDLTLATGSIEINFATNLFFTTFLQYNTQADNFNVNARFQWRFAPMSDLFLVYTDNYLVDGMFGPKNRSVVLKANYWLTL